MMKQAFLKNRTWQALLVLGMLMGLSACVTVNIYFPAAAAKRLADQVVGEVYKAAAHGAVSTPTAPTLSAPAQVAPAAPAAAPAPSAFERLTPAHVAGYLLATSFSALSTPDEAGADLNASSPGVQAARAQLESIAA
ncbi:DUF1318 domain-containing protein, partial [Acidithiobacillus sp. RW2]|nr:DUF1318 domain-containing protein [Acidithiobacillus sulfurivorans]